MRLSNYPDGVSEGDLPSYWDRECPVCEDRDPEEEYEVCSVCNDTGMCDERALKAYWREEARVRAWEDENV